MGRFNHIDPQTAMAPGLSPYHFGFNHLVRYSDPMGLMGNDAGKWGTGNTYASTHSQNPFDLMPKFTRTNPGSGNHWADQYRDPYHNWMPMDTDGFRDFYGLDNGFGGTNFEKAMKLTGSFTGIGSSQGGSFFYGVNGMGDGNGNIIPGTEVYILYQHLTDSRPSWGSNGYERSYTGNVLGIGGITYAGIENAVANKFWWMDAKGNYNSTTILEKGANGKFVRGVQGNAIKLRKKAFWEQKKPAFLMKTGLL